MGYRAFDSDTLEREYTPASRIPNIQIYLDRYQQRGEAARKATLHQKLIYGNHPDEWLWYAPHNDPRGGLLIVFIHGGFWRRLSADDGTFLTPKWRQLGYSVASINYSLCPDETLETLVRQISQAIDFLGSLHDPQNIVLVGHSAGSQLAAMAMCEPSAPLFMGTILVSGIFDLEPIIHTSVNAAVKLDIESARRLSPINYITQAKNTPVAVIWGQNETAEFKRQSKEFAQAWTQSADKKAAKTLEIKNRNHFDVLDELGRRSILRLLQ